MSIDPGRIKSESFREIGSIIEKDAGILIQRWSQRAVQEQPNARRVHHEALLDHLPDFLQALARTLSETDEEATNEHCHSARQHGEQRWETGWSLSEVIRDYQILRLTVLDYLEDVLDRPLSCRETMAVGLALDEAIAASASRYVRSRDEEFRQNEARRTEEQQKIQEAMRQQADLLREADRRKNEFLATLAHELRNPLAPLRNAVGILYLHQASDPTLVQVRGILERQVQHLSRLVDDLLDVSRIAQGKTELRKERLNLATVLNQVAQMSEALMHARRHRFEINLPAAPLWLEADQARLMQILVNLLNNAAKYTNPGGHIQLSAECAEQQVVIRVRDNGVGIAAEMLPHVFDLFTQAEWSLDRSQGGLGIGLTLVRRLVELHNGTITAHSDGLGRGSEFVVKLALCAADDGARETGNTSPATPAGRSVLIVEDNDDGRESLAMLLKLLGHRVEVAEDGFKGVAMALARRPDVALIDLGLPGMDGYQVAAKLRDAFGPRVSLVALTGSGQPDDHRLTQEAGFDRHLVKPVDPEVLQAVVISFPAATPESGERPVNGNGN